MRRALFNLLVVGSLLVGAVTVGLWVRSFWSTDLVYFTIGPAFCQLCSQDSTMYAEVNTDCRPYSCWPQFSFHSPGFTDPPSTFNWRTLGFGWKTGISGYVGMPPGMRYRILRVPDWFLLVMASVLPAAWVVRRRMRRFGPGQCRKCGYDLRASKERCPECGELVASESVEGVKA